MIFGISPRRNTFAAYVKRNLEKSGCEDNAVNTKANNGFFGNLNSLPFNLKQIRLLVVVKVLVLYLYQLYFYVYARDRIYTYASQIYQ